MAKFLLVCSRDGTAHPESRIKAASELLVPDNITPAPPETRRTQGITLTIVTPTPSIATHETSACIGQMFEKTDDWWSPGAAVPDGTFALIRANERSVELATDIVGSRSVFYAMTDSLFIASTSQRAIVAVLGAFRPNAVAVSWMLSSGSLGPSNSWDERITRLGADARVVLDRTAWKLTSRHSPVVFHPERRSREEHATRLSDAIREVCETLDLSGEWRLPLSGGRDSRYLLLSLVRSQQRISCITWGTRSALDDPESDAAVARTLARYVGIPHEFFPMDLSPEPVEVLFDRFLRNGDGCVDHIRAYMDGFEVWRHLHEAGVAGVIRGDEALGSRQPVTLPSAVRPVLGATALTEYYPGKQVENFGLADQPWPDEFERQRGESIQTWRDRLYQVFRGPVVLASLTDLKVPYVEVTNPLLSRRVVEVARALPDELRAEKALFCEMVDSASPPIPFALRAAIPDFHGLVTSGPFLALVRREVIAGREEGSLPASFVDFLLPSIPMESRAPKSGESVAFRADHRASLRDRAITAARKLVPRHLGSALRAVRRRRQPSGALAFRAALVARMTRMLHEAARAGAPPSDQAHAARSPREAQVYRGLTGRGS